MAAVQQPFSVVSPSDFANARASLLAEEKALTRAHDALAAKRRTMPRVLVTNPSQFKFTTSDNQTITLTDLFAKRKQLLMYQFMLPSPFESDKTRGCQGCSFFCDHIPHSSALNHLNARNTTFVAVAPADIKVVNDWKERMGWDFPFYSFPDLLKEGKDENGEEVSWKAKDGLFGLVAFVMEDDGKVYHTYYTSMRGVENMLSTLKLLDLTALGRQDDNKEVTGKLKDEYGEKVKGEGCGCGKA